MFFSAKKRKKETIGIKGKKDNGIVARKIYMNKRKFSGKVKKRKSNISEVK